MTKLRRFRIRSDAYASSMETALGSKARLRILRLLAKYPNHALTKYRICQTTGLRNQSASRHLNKLLEKGLIQSRGTIIRRYTLNHESEEASLLREFFTRIRLAQ